MPRDSGMAVAKRPPSQMQVLVAVLYKIASMAKNLQFKPHATFGIAKNLAMQARGDQHMARALLAFATLFVCTGGRLRLKNGHAILFMPMWIYDVCAQTNFVTNWMIGAATFCLNVLPFQTAPDWNTDEGLSPETIAASPEALRPMELGALKQSILDDKNGFLKEHHIIQLFDSLKAARPDDLTGKAFRGRIIMSGRCLDVVNLGIQLMRIVGLKWGKRYRTQYVGDPLCVTWLNRFHFPQPGWGNVGMHAVNYRGRPCATMAYDHQPWHDMFAVLDDGVESGRMKFLGLWCHRQKSGGWFTLTELPDVDVTL